MNTPVLAKRSYLTVYETLLRQIDGHLLTPGMQLRPEMELARDLGVSRMTVRKALNRLEDEGRIYCRAGIGSFVKAPQPPKQRQKQVAIGIEIHAGWTNREAFSARIVEEMRQASTLNGCHLVLRTREELLAGQNIDAAFFMILPREEFGRAAKLAERLPTVLLNRINDYPQLGYVAVDYTDAACRIVRRIIRNGSTRILFIGGAASDSSYGPYTRELGYRRAFQQEGKKIDENFIIPLELSQDYQEIADRIVRTQPDVVFVCSEILVMRVYAALEKVQEKLARPVYVFSFDDMRDLSVPGGRAISCGRMPFADMCSTAVRHLAGQVRGELPNEPVRKIFPLSYIITDCPFLI